MAYSLDPTAPPTRTLRATARGQIDGAPGAVLRDGLKRAYGQARKRWRKAIAAPHPAPLHDWRKRGKNHRYHCRLLRDASPAAMKLRVAALGELADALGADHDLVVLIATIRDGAPDLRAASLHLAETLAATRSQHLRAKAVAAAPRPMIGRPDPLATRSTAQWALSTR